MATGITTTENLLYCNAQVQEFTVQTGLDFLNSEIQHIKLVHNSIIMKGWLKSYNSETGIIQVLIDWYNGAGGDSYSSWEVYAFDLFVDLSNDYINTLKNNNSIIDGALVSTNEDLQTSIAKFSFLVGEEVKQKYVVIYKNEGVMSYRFYVPTDIVTTYDFSLSGWHYPGFEKRIVAPIALANQYPAIEVWFRLNNLPIIVENSIVYLYCNTILADHQAMVDALQGVITIEERPIT